MKNLKTMARMGVYLEENVQQRYPEFPRARRAQLSWEDYLPPLSPSCCRLAEAQRRVNFLENIFDRLRHSTDRPVLQQVDQGKLLSSSGRQVLGLVHAARTFC